MIDNCLVNFNPIVKYVLNSRLNFVLPPNFIVPPTTKPTNPTVVLSGDDMKMKRNREKKMADGEEDNDRMAKNTAPIKEFLLKEG